MFLLHDAGDKEEKAIGYIAGWLGTVTPRARPVYNSARPGYLVSVFVLSRCNKVM